jgi:hypothetical protein
MNNEKYEEVNPYSVSGELAESFRVVKNEDGSIDIFMHVEKRFATLVWVLLSDLAATPDEFSRYVKDE